MDKDPRCISEMILNLTLEIIYLLTGEMYTVVKTSGEQLAPNSHSRTSARLNRKHDEKILEVTQKIIELLTGEVPIRCQDVSVYFSMEEWEYLEGHKDLYEDVMEENQKCALTDSSNKDVGQESGDWQGNGKSKMRPGSLGKFVEENPDLHHNSDTSWILKDKSHSCNKNVDKNKELAFLDTKTSSAEGLELTEAMPVLNVDNIAMYIKKESFLGDNDGYNDLCTTIGPMTYNTSPPKNAYHSSSPKFPTFAGILPDLPKTKSKDHTGQPTRQKIATEVQSPFRCTLCGKSFACNSALETHNRIHTGEKPFSCKKCGKSFMRIAGLCAHKKVHDREWLFQCSECARRFSCKSHFVRHQMTHAKKVQVSSSECDRGAYNGPDLVGRLNGNACEEPNACGEVGALGSQADLTHLCRTFAPEEPYACPNCDKCFESRSALRAHKKAHRENQQLPCPYCPKCFRCRSDLERHERIHTGEKPFPCSYCDKRFAHRFSVAIHERIHTGEKPYSCSVCGRRFTDLSSFVAHRKRHDRDTKNT